MEPLSFSTKHDTGSFLDSRPQAFPLFYCKGRTSEKRNSKEGGYARPPVFMAALQLSEMRPTANDQKLMEREKDLPDDAL